MKQYTCFDNPSRDDIVLIRRWHVRFCAGNHCAAAILSYFDYWHSIKLEQREKAIASNNVAEMHGENRTQDESLLQFHTYEEISEKIFSMYGKNKIAESIKLLEKRRAISIYRNPNPKFKFDNTSFFLLNVRRVENWLKSYKKHVVLKVKRRALKLKHETLKVNDQALKEGDGALNSNLLHYTVSSSLLSSVKKEESHFLEAQIQKQEKPNAEPLPTESTGGCAEPETAAGMRAKLTLPPAEQRTADEATGSLRANSERPAAGVDSAGVGEDFPSWVGYVATRYGTHDRRAVEKHLKGADKIDRLTGEKVAAWVARCGTFSEWLRSSVDGAYAGKPANFRSNGIAHGHGLSGRANGHAKHETAAVEYKRPAPPNTSADRTREFFFEKLLPLDIKCHGKQTLFYNPQEHPKLFAMAWQCDWPEEEILKRLPRYWRSTNDFYRKAGYNLRLFFQNFDEFADQLSKIEMRYPLLSEVHAAQERAGVI